MPILASDILAESRLILNDNGAKVYTNAVLLPLLRKAYEEFQSWADNYNLYYIKRQSFDLTPLTVAGNYVVISASSTPPLPTDLRVPVRLYEKAVGEDRSFYVLMEEKEFQAIVDVNAGRTTYGYWNFNGQAIFLPNITSPSSRNVLIEYLGSDTAIADATTTLPQVYFRQHLAARVAAMAAMYIGQNESRAAAAQDDANTALDRILEVSVRKNQGTYGARRIPFGATRRIRESFAKWWS